METIIKNAKDANTQVSNFQILRTEELKISLKELFDANQDPFEISQTLRDYKTVLMAASALKQNYSDNEIENLPEDIQHFLNLFNDDFMSVLNGFWNIELMERFLEAFAIESKVRNDEFDQLTKDF